MPAHKKQQRDTDNPAYGSWSSMVQRCRNQKRADFARYGAAGISVCAEWARFACFLSDMGPRPSARHSLDRIDPALGYLPGNVRWANSAEQARNRKSTRLLEHDGRVQCVSDWAAELGISKGTLALKTRNGWTVQQVLQAKPYSRHPA